MNTIMLCVLLMMGLVAAFFCYQAHRAKRKYDRAKADAAAFHGESDE
jgi:hypothetical protein